jgi:hypothetical protein
VNFICYHFSYYYQYIFIVYNIQKNTQIKYICNFMYTYTFQMLCIESHVACIQTKYYRSFPHNKKLGRPCIETRLRNRRPRFNSRQRRGKDFFSSPPLPDRLWGPPSLLSYGYRELLRRGQSDRCLKPITHLHLVPRLIMHDVPPFLYVVMACCLIKQKILMLLLIDFLKITL